MFQIDQDAVKRRISEWKNTAFALEAERSRATGAEESRRFIHMTAGLISALARKTPPSVTSGFVAQQQYFLRARRSPMISP